MKRRVTIGIVASVIVAAAVLAGLFLCPGQAPSPLEVTNLELLSRETCPGCNILLITVETLRADHLRCQGYEEDVAPNLCAFGEEGLLFENAYTPAPVTIPALRALMSGTLVSNEDLTEIIAHHETPPSLAAKLAKRGYITAGITDHRGLGDLSLQRPKSSVIIRDFQHFENLGEGRERKTSARVASSVEEWLAGHRSEKFFLWTHLFDPHFNWVPREETQRAFGYREDDCGRIRNGIDIEEIRTIEKDLSPREIECLAALYHAEIFETDRLIGDILRRLEQLGLADHTLVIILGDHGEELRERDRIGHEWTVYNELIHVPLMIGNPRSDRVIRQPEPISTLAIHDYILAAVEGRKLEALPPVVSRAFHYYGQNTADPREFQTRPNEFALISGNLKIISTPLEGKNELYDLSKDPAERRNLWGPNEESDRMALELRSWIDANRADPGAITSDAMDSYMEMVERLRALGYTR